MKINSRVLRNFTNCLHSNTFTSISNCFEVEMIVFVKEEDSILLMELKELWGKLQGHLTFKGHRTLSWRCSFVRRLLTIILQTIYYNEDRDYLFFANFSTKIFIAFYIYFRHLMLLNLRRMVFRWHFLDLFLLFLLFLLFIFPASIGTCFCLLLFCSSCSLLSFVFRGVEKVSVA